MPSDGSTAESGFTLPEVLVAFLILSAAMVAANQSISYSIRAIDAARTSRAADRVTEKIFSERISLDVGVGAMGVESGIEQNRLSWTLKREPKTLKTLNSIITVTKVTLTVRAQEDDRVLHTYMTYRVTQPEVNRTPK